MWKVYLMEFIVVVVISGIWILLIDKHYNNEKRD